MIRRVSALVVVFLVLIIAGCGGTSSASTQVSASLDAKGLPNIQPPAYIPGPLDGASTPRRLALRRPLAVIVENYAPDSRPQTGLSQASTVFETLAEGGVTRFMAVFLERDAAKVGPVRSTRMYFDRWATSFHAVLTHVGGNDDAQNYLWTAQKVLNIDEQKTEVSLYNTGSPLFWRSPARVAPHNMYVSTYKIRSHVDRLRQDWAYQQAYLPHKAAALTAQRGHRGSLWVSFQDPLYPHPDSNYDVRYDYDRTSNTYLRIMGGAPHVDTATNRPLRPANVIVMKTGPAAADPNAGPCVCSQGSILIPTVGSGPAWYFRDGKVTAGRWQQRNDYAPLRFYDARGRLAAFNPGQTWIEVIPSNGSSVIWRFR